MAKTLYLIDASGFIFRAYHKLPPLTRPDGTVVGAVYGYVTMLMKLMEGMQGDYVAAIFDKNRATFRNRIYPDYKAHRPPAPEDLVPQFAIVREATTALNLPVIELDDFEADDIIATYTRLAREQGVEVVIVSSDKDLMQCIGDGVSMYDALKNKPVVREDVIEKFGVPPEKVLDVLSLIGDSSDNVPGVPGIGPKTAAELIIEFGDLDGLLAHTDRIKQPKRRETIQTNAEKARLSRELITLHDHAPVPFALEELAAKAPEPEMLAGFCAQQGFKSLVARIKSKYALADEAIAAANPASPTLTDDAPAAPSHCDYQLVQELPSLKRWIERATAAGIVAFDTETTSLDAMQAELVGFSLAITPGEACYVPLTHCEPGENKPIAADLFTPASNGPALLPGQISKSEALALLKPLLEDASVLKIGHNIKYDMLVLAREGLHIHPVDDTMLMSYCLHAGEHGQGMDELAEKYLNHSNISYDSVTGTGKNRLCFNQVALDKARDYAAEDADITLRMQHFFRPQLQPAGLLTLYETIERPLVPVIVAMEKRGIKVDLAQLQALSQDFAQRLATLELAIHQLAGHAFNIASPKQLGEVLFDELQLGKAKKTAKTDHYSTSNDVLEELAEQGHALPAKVIEWRQLAKLKSTYTDALAQQINPTTKRVHTSYALAVASTGRLSSSEPNLQNIPIRTEEGKKIRHAFVAEPGYQLISADYSQIELRLLAHIATIAPLKAAFTHGDDIHAITASQMFGVPVADVSSDLRRKAKTINFGIIYGISAHGLAARLGISRSEAGQYIEQYFQQYPGIRDYMEHWKLFAREHGYVTTLFGRRCHVPGIHDKNAARRQFSERAAINAPLQGTAADIIKRAMIRCEGALAQSGLDCKMLLQVHDELIFEVKEGQADAAISLIRREMEGSAHLSVPLTVEAGAGRHWGEIH